jgi:transcriptional regulator with XRE-family HTH domain
MASRKVTQHYIEYIKRIRINRYSSTEEFAAAAGIGKSTADKFLNGHPVDAEIFRELASLLEMDWFQISEKAGGLVLVLDDEQCWIDQLKRGLKDFNCQFFQIGQDIIDHVKADSDRQVKLLIIDELLLIDDQRQPDQGKSIREKIRNLRADIVFIVIANISTLENQVLLESEKGVQGVVSKLHLTHPEISIREAGYRLLLSHIHGILGEVANQEENN